jgi:anti-anti-sigma factor
MHSSNSFDPPTVALPAQIDVYSPPLSDPQRPAVVTVHGEVDASNADEVGLVATSLLGDLSDVVVDLAAVSFISSSGLWILTDLPVLARHHGLGYAIVASAAVNRLLKIAGRQRPEWVFDTAESAMSAVEDEAGTLEHLVGLRSPPLRCS